MTGMRVVATAGHVDHGKSTLVRALTGMEPDRWEEERRRGLTIDLGFVWADLEGGDGETHTVAFVDVPGHHRFVSNMLAGAGALHDALLVVAADDGWSPQSAEHLAILDLLAIRGIAVVVTKADTVDGDRLDQVVDDVTTRLADTTLAGTPVVAVDSLTGRGLDELRHTLVRRLTATDSHRGGPDVRLWIDRSFTVSGAGTVVTGTVQGGPLRVGMEVRHSPAGRTLRIRGLQSLGDPVGEAWAGSRVAVNLAGVSHEDLERGDALLTGEWIETTAVDAVVRCVGDRSITMRGAWHAHVGAAELPVMLRPLLGSIDPLDDGPARIELSRPVPLRYGDRLVLRDVGEQATSAGARVLDPLAGPRPRGLLARLEATELLDELARSDDDAERVALLLRAHGGWAPISDVEAVFGLGSSSALEGVSPVGEYLVLEAEREAWSAAAVSAADQAEPGRGAFLEDVVAAVGAAGCPPNVRRAIVEGLAARDILQIHDTVVTTAADAPAYLAARERRRQDLLDEMSADLLRPPDLQEVAERMSVRGAELQRLFDSRDLVRIGDVVVTAAAIARAREDLKVAFGGDPFTAAEARDAWGTTRKFAVPLLEHLARTGETSFDGECHRLK